MTRLYVSGVPLAVGARLALPESAKAHVRARRVREGESLVLFDGSGQEFLATLVALDRKEAFVEIQSVAAGLGFATPQLTLALSVIAADRMDWAIQKCCELGIAAVIPVLAERSQAPGNAAHKVAHWQAVAASAAEQSGRAQVANIAAPLRLEAALSFCKLRPKKSDFAPQVWMCEQTSSAPTPAPAEAEHFVFVGPEGGWTDAERAHFATENTRTLPLSRATLRTETAAVAAAVKLLQIQ